jgi:hypothetical protein
MEQVEARPVDELIKIWPDTWNRFDSVVDGVAMVQEKPDESALKTLVTQPVQEMLKVRPKPSRFCYIASALLIFSSSIVWLWLSC